MQTAPRVVVALWEPSRRSALQVVENPTLCSSCLHRNTQVETFQRQISDWLSHLRTVRQQLTGSTPKVTWHPFAWQTPEDFGGTLRWLFGKDVLRRTLPKSNFLVHRWYKTKDKRNLRWNKRQAVSILEAENIFVFRWAYVLQREASLPAASLSSAPLRNPRGRSHQIWGLPLKHDASSLMNSKHSSSWFHASLTLAPTTPPSHLFGPVSP